VPAGPGVMLIGHEANYSLDLTKKIGSACSTRGKQAGGEAQENRDRHSTPRGRVAALEQESAFRRKPAIQFGPIANSPSRTGCLRPIGTTRIAR